MGSLGGLDNLLAGCYNVNRAWADKTVAGTGEWVGVGRGMGSGKTGGLPPMDWTVEGRNFTR